MATVPLSGTNIALYSGIPFSNDYKHTRWFDTLADQQNWFASQTHVATFTNANFQRAEGTGAILRVNMSVDELWNVNYISFQNADYGKVFYGFVTEIEYVQNKTTRVHFEIDVMQTWRFDMNFQPSFVAREHCPLWNTDGSPVINTVPEDLNYGTEYDTVYANNIQANNGYKWLVILAKGKMHDGGNGTVIAPVNNGVPTPLTTYFIPFQAGKSAPNVHINNPLPLQTADGTMSSPKDVLNALYKMSTAIGNVVSLYVTEHIGIGVSVTDGNGSPDMINFPNGSDVQIVSISDGTNTFYSMYLTGIDGYSSSDYFAGGKYDGYKTVTESKLLMYPYTQLVLDDFKGSRATFKNEYINDSNLYITIKGSLGTSNRCSYSIQAYNSGSDAFQWQRSDEFGLLNVEPSDVPIIDDNLAAFMQGNKNSINNQKASIMWNGMMGAVNGGLNTAVQGAMMGPLGIAQGAGQVLQGAGNMQLQLNAIEAKQNDIANVPPSLAKMGSNTMYTYGNGYSGVFLLKKQIKDEYIKKLTDYFNMYGYKKNEVKIPNFHTRQNWNYVQTVGCVIRASINNEDLQELKSVFDNGITLWHVDDIGNYTLSNGVI